jgi:hypothetical protein
MEPVIEPDRREQMEQAKREPNVGERRVVPCGDSEVVAEYTGEHGGWLHLHNDDPDDDAKEVRKFQRTSMRQGEPQ